MLCVVGDVSEGDKKSKANYWLGIQASKVQARLSGYSKPGCVVEEYLASYWRGANHHIVVTYRGDQSKGHDLKLLV